MHRLKTSIQVVRTLGWCSLHLLLLPLARTASDRIDAHHNLENTLTWEERLRPTSRWSLRSILRRAARRQEKLNAIGHAFTLEYEYRRKHRYRTWPYWYFGQILIPIFAVGVGGTTFEEFLRQQHPQAYLIWVAVLQAFLRGVEAFWRGLIEVLRQMS